MLKSSCWWEYPKTLEDVKESEDQIITLVGTLWTGTVNQVSRREGLSTYTWPVLYKQNCQLFNISIKDIHVTRRQRLQWSKWAFILQTASIFAWGLQLIQRTLTIFFSSNLCQVEWTGRGQIADGHNYIRHTLQESPLWTMHPAKLSDIKIMCKVAMAPLKNMHIHALIRA